jgi:protein gp37
MMAENSHISWTDNTFNPWMGCTKVSPACQHCYAERDMDHRYGKVAWGPSGTRVKTSTANWNKPLKWNREATAGHRPLVFCASLADVFEEWGDPIHDSSGDIICRPYLDSENLPEFWCATDPESLRTDPQGWSPITMHDLRRELFKLIDKTPNLDWLLLTKRPENVEKMWTEANSILTEIPMGVSGKLYRTNVILGTSIESQEWTDKRLPHLHAAKRHGLVSKTFVSAEPLVGPIMLQGEANGLVYNHLGGTGIDWVITGGESGPDARPCKPEWFRSLRDQAEAAGVPFHFKQWGEFDASENRVGVNVAGRVLDGQTHDGMPRVAVA